MAMLNSCLSRHSVTTSFKILLHAIRNNSRLVTMSDMIENSSADAASPNVSGASLDKTTLTGHKKSIGGGLSSSTPGRLLAGEAAVDEPAPSYQVCNLAKN